MKHFLIGLFLFCSVIAYSAGDTVSSGKNLLFGFTSDLYFVNNEYFSLFKEGYTMPGYTVSPWLLINARHVEFGAGFVLRSYFEQDNASQMRPAISARVSKNNGFALTLGFFAIETHSLDQEYNKECVLTRPYREGILVENNNAIPFVLYVDWLNYIFPQDSAQEIFHGHFSSRLENAEKKSFFATHIFAFEVFHKGGQINADPKPPLTMIYNAKIGCELQKLRDKSVHKFQIALLGFSDVSQNTLSSFAEGYATCVTYSFDWATVHGTMSFWHSNRYYSPFGNELFFSDKYAGGTQKQRNVLSFLVEKRRVFDRWAFLSSAAYVHFDADRQKADYGFSIILHLKDSFSLINNI